MKVMIIDRQGEFVTPLFVMTCQDTVVVMKAVADGTSHIQAGLWIELNNWNRRQGDYDPFIENFMLTYDSATDRKITITEVAIAKLSVNFSLDAAETIYTMQTL